MANRYWIASSAGNWNDTANWSTTSGGAGGASVPGGGDDAIFDSGGLGDCNNAAGSIGAFKQNASYSGTVTITNTLTLYATGNIIGGAVVLGGTYGRISYIQGPVITLEIQSTGSLTGGSGTTWYWINFAQNGQLTIDPSATVSISGGVRLGRYATLTQACNLSCNLYLSGHATFNNNMLLPSGTISVDGNLYVNGVNGTGVAIIDTATNDTSFAVSGDVQFSNLGTLDWQVGTGTITLNGTGSQAVNFAGDSVNAIVVSDAASGPITLGANFTTPYVHDCNNLIDLNGFTITKTGTDPSPCVSYVGYYLLDEPFKRL